MSICPVGSQQGATLLYTAVCVLTGLSNRGEDRGTTQSLVHTHAVCAASGRKVDGGEQPCRRARLPGCCWECGTD